MTQQFAHRLMFVILLICQPSICLATESPDPNDTTKYLDAVRTFADNVLKYGRDTYGPKHTPLFVDGLNIHTHEPVEWIDPDGTKWILSNLASQQNLFRVLDGLTTITGDPKYRQAAEEAIRYAFANLRSPNGLLYWGIRVAYDAQKDGISDPGKAHILKSQHPYYELMWEVDAEATRQFIEAFWSAHILDWSNLEMNRASHFNERLEKPWSQEYTGGPVFFQSRGRSMLTTGSDLFCAAGLLTRLSGNREPLIWAKRLAYRYVETRNPHVGISGHGYTRKEIDATQYNIGKDFEGHLVLRPLITLVPGLGNPDVRESILGYIMITPGVEYNMTISPWASSIILGDILGNDGRDFIKWGLEELTALGKVAYRPQDNVFIPMINDGTSLEGYVWKDGASGERGLELKAIPVVPMDFWVYALAYRVTGDQFMWHMARSMASGHDLGDIGITPETHPQLKTATDCWHPFILLGFLELYRKTGNQAFLQIAQGIGDNMLTQRFHKGFFVPSDKHIYTKFDAIEPLVLLNLHVALKANSVSVPIVWPGRSLFNVAYRNRRLAMDNSLIYTLTDSSEPPKSLLEAATEGDLDGAKAMIARGVNVNERDQYDISALHYASRQGHLEVAELLIAKGARVNGGFWAPLHSAARFGRKDMIELLIAKGAHINARSNHGETPLYYAVREGHEETAELLIVKGANVNTKNAVGYTPLHYAVRTGGKDVAELLITKGADVNAKNNNGQTPVDIAVIGNRKEFVELLIAKGADVSLHVAARFGALTKVKSLIEKGYDINAKDESGQAALHYAAEIGRKDIAELLIVKGADVNAKNNNRQTPVDIATSRNRSEVVKLLIAKGADVSLHVAVRFGALTKVRALIEEGVSVDVRDEAGNKALDVAMEQNYRIIAELLVANGATVSIHVAAYLGDTAKVMNFIEQGSDVNTKHQGGGTPLHYASMAGSIEVSELLLARGADIKAKDKGGATPLHRCSMKGHRDLAEFLITKGADIDARDDKWGETPLHWSANSGRKAVVELLIAKGADINVKDKTGHTPLYWAAHAGHRDVAELLIAKGADVNAKENDSKTPLQIAKDKGHTEIVELLKKHGAKE